jgi:hypothetical protein
MDAVQKWMWGVVFTLILACFAYVARVDSETERRILNSEDRVIERIKNVDQKVQWILEHLVNRDRLGK